MPPGMYFAVTCFSIFPPYAVRQIYIRLANSAGTFIKALPGQELCTCRLSFVTVIDCTQFSTTFLVIIRDLLLTGSRHFKIF